MYLVHHHPPGVHPSVHSTSYKHTQGETVIAIRAPQGTTLEVPDPDEGMQDGERRYEVQLMSRNGPVDIFLVKNPSTEGVSWIKQSTHACPFW